MLTELVALQVGFWAHMRGISVAIGDSILWYMSGFMAFFSIVIALFKDIPDVKGDAMHGNRTASVRMGVPKVFWTCIMLLMCMYIGSVSFILYFGGNFKGVVAACQSALAAVLMSRARSVDLKSSADVVSMYMLIWNLFYAQYLMFPLITLTVM
jgi:homogentisate phytyltransferase / homogentisate geranylgeranyltransferase